MSLLKTKNIFNNSKYLNIVKKQFSLTKFILENRFKTKILKSNENSFTRLYREIVINIFLHKRNQL